MTKREISETPFARVMGVDPSLTATGVAYADGSSETLSWQGTGVTRLKAANHWAHFVHVDAELVVIEGYAFAARHSQAHALGELGGVLRLGFLESGVDVLEVPPATLKKFATGKGNASKADVLVSAVKRLDYGGSSHDEADALWLREIGLSLADQSTVDLPASHLAALDKLKSARDA